MHFHYDCGENGRHRFAGRGRGFSFGPGGFHFDFGEEAGGWGGGRRGRGRKRTLEGSELQLLLLRFIETGASHGYQLIKAIENMTEGEYAPSPGIVYPTLTMLEDMGFITEQKSEDNKKVFEITEEGRAHLADNEGQLIEIIGRLEGYGHHRRRGQRPEIGRAIGNLMTALRNRIAHEGWNDQLLDEVIDILDEAAQRIERVRDAKEKDD